MDIQQAVKHWKTDFVTSYKTFPSDIVSLEEAEQYTHLKAPIGFFV